MANRDEERVEYSFTGDVSSLKKATEEAISLLDKFGASMDAATTAGTFTASQRATKSFNASIKRMMKDVTALQAKLKNVGDVRLPSGSQPAEALAGTFGTLTDQLAKFNSTEAVTTKSLTEMKRHMEAARQSVSSTIPQVDKLVASEQRFQNILGTVTRRTDEFTNRMQSTKSQIGDVFTPVTSRLQAFGDRFRSVFSSVVRQIQSFRDRAATAFSRVSQLASAVVTSLQRVKKATDDDSAASERNANIKKRLTDIWNRMSSIGRSVSSVLQAIGRRLQQMAPVVQKLAQGFRAVTSTLGTFASRIGAGVSELTKFGSSARQSSTAVDALKKAAAGLTAVKLGEWLSKATSESIRYVENLNLFTVAMGSSIESAREFTDAMAEHLGLDPSNIMRHAGYFYQLADAIHMPAEASKILSLSLTRAANDIASLFNVKIEQVTDNLASGMHGMSRAVRKYGIDIRNSTLETIALRYGIEQQVGTMSEANRQALRFIAIIEQTSKATQQLTTDSEGNSVAMGDFARHIEAPANQLRIFKEQMSQLGRAIGDIFIQPLATAIAYINGFVMALRTAINFITAFFGVDVSGLGGTAAEFDENADAINGVGSAASDAAKKMKQLMAPFDELNVLSENASKAGGAGLNDELLDPALLKAIQEMELELDRITMRAHEVRDAILEFFGLTWDAEGQLTFDKSLFEESLIDAFPEWEATIKEAFENWDLSGIGQVVGVIISGSLSKFADFISWDSVGGEVTSVLDDFHTLVNSAIRTMRGEDIGRAIGEFFNTGMKSAFTLISGIDWTSMGVLIGDGITAAVESVDWATLGEFLVLKWNVLVTLFYNAVTTIDWTLLAESFSTGLNSMVESINIEELAAGLGVLLRGVLQVVGHTITQFDWAGQGARVGRAVQTLWSSIDWTSVGQALSDGMSGIFTFMQEAINQIDWQQLGADIATSFATIDWEILMEQLVTVAATLIQGLVDGLIEALPAIVNAAGDIITGLINGLTAAMPTLIPSAVSAISTIVLGLIQQLPQIISAAGRLIVALSEGLIAAIPQLLLSVPKIIKSLVTSLIGAISDIIITGKDIGLNLVTGIWEGISGAGRWLKGKVTGFFGDVTGWAKNVLGIQSPSTVFADIGDDTIQGFSEGMSDNSSPMSILDEMFRLMENATEEQKDQMARWSENVTGAMLGAFRGMFAAMLGDQANFQDDWNKHLAQLQGTSENWARQLAELMRLLFKNMWTAMLNDTDTFARDLQRKLDSMVSAARMAAAAISKAMSSAQAGVSMSMSVATRNVPAMATGGVVTRPTYALIGEGAYDEAVIPLGNSPQMAEFAQAVADAVRQNPDNPQPQAPVNVRVVIGGKEWNVFTYESAKEGEVLVGAEPIKVGGS